MRITYNLGSLLFTEYLTYQEQAFEHKHFKHDLIAQLIEKHQESGIFQISELGQSEENRSVWQVRYGTGERRILMWSQMHGDEATATMAIFDILNFLSSDWAKNNLEDWRERFSLYFIPMLNPDGAERGSRYNALGIDLNRDGFTKQTAEAKMLWKAKETISPQFAFNLHDQERFYSVGKTSIPASLSFLANLQDDAEAVSANRLASMQLIAMMNAILQPHIPNRIGRYVSEFDPTSFGDSFQQTGTATLLIESGAYPNDPDRMFVRKLNFVGILAAVSAIAHNAHQSFSAQDYNQIPENKNRLFDVLLKNINYKHLNGEISLDLGINYQDLKDPTSAKLIALGDLQSYSGYEQRDASSQALYLPEGIVLEREMDFNFEWIV